MMKRISHILILVLVMAAFCSNVYAIDAGRESHFSLGSGTRALGMGGGFVGLADDASAVYWNQAALARLDYQQVDLMHVTLSTGTIYDVGSYVYPHEKWGGFGLSFMRIGTGDIPVVDNYIETGNMSYSMAQFILGYGRKLERGLSIGAALKLVNQSMGDNSTYGTGIDLSAMFEATRHVTAGLILQDLVAPRLRLRGNLEVIPQNAIAGIGVTDIKSFDKFIHNFSLGIEKPEFRSTKIHLGAEAVYDEFLSMRLGFDRENMSFGLGINYDRVRFDYAYRFMDGFTDSHRFGININIGRSIPDKIREAQELESARGSYLVLDDRRRQFDLYKGMADGFFEYNQMDSALVYYQRALAYNENNIEVKALIARIETILETQQVLANETQNREERRQSLIDGYYRQALGLYEGGDFKASLSAIEMALVEAPEDTRFLTLRELAATGQKRLVDSLSLIAGELEANNKTTEALEAYYKVIELDPQNESALASIESLEKSIRLASLIKEGVEFFTTKNFSAASRKFEQVLQLDPGNSVATDYKSRISVLMKEVTDLEDLEKDERVWRIYLTALEHFRNGEYENAIRLWEEVLQYYPGNVSTINNIEQARLRLDSEQ